MTGAFSCAVSEIFAGGTDHHVRPIFPGPGSVFEISQVVGAYAEGPSGLPAAVLDRYLLTLRREIGEAAPMTQLHGQKYNEIENRRFPRGTSGHRSVEASL